MRISSEDFDSYKCFTNRIIGDRKEYSRIKGDTDVYSHILDEDRKKNARLFEKAFYEKKNLNSQMHETPEGKMLSVSDGVDAELLAKVLSNPEMVALLTSLSKNMN